MPQRIDLRSSNEHVAFQNLTSYYKKIQYKSNKLKIIAPTWKDEFELSDGSYSMSDIQDYVQYIIKIMKHYPLILLFILTSKELIIRLVFKIKDVYKLELQTPETMKLFGSTKS